MISNEDGVAALSAGLGGFVSSFVLYPVEIVKNRYQAELKQRGRAASTFKSILLSTARERGLRGLYAGVEKGAIQSAIEKAIYYLIYASEWSHMILTMPMDVSLKLYQIRQKENPPKSYATVVRDHFRSRGLRGFYHGASAYVVLCAKPAIQYCVFESLKKVALRKTRKKDLSAFVAFFLGAISRAIATLIIFPFIRANAVRKGKMDSADDDGLADLGTLRAIARVASEHGFMSLYQGLAPQLSRGVMSAALAMVVKERTSALARSLFARR
eukprot:g2511.t1